MGGRYTKKREKSPGEKKIKNQKKIEEGGILGYSKVDCNETANDSP